MKLWFAHSSEVPIYRQLSTQVALGILSGDLQPGERLPSTRELARRFALHPNTISAGYRRLEQEGWTERRHGSGIYVRARSSAPATPEQLLDHHIAGFFRAARELGLPADVVRTRVTEWLSTPAPSRFLLIDPDPELRRILLTELTGAATWPVAEASLAACATPALLAGAVPLCRPSQAAAVRAELPRGIELVTLPIRSPNAWLLPWLPAPAGHLVAVASHWPEFVETARTILVAAGLPAESLLLRDARTPRWRRGLEQTSVILCDAFTETLLLPSTRPQVVVYALLADEVRAKLAAHTS